MWQLPEQSIASVLYIKQKRFLLKISEKGGHLARLGEHNVNPKVMLTKFSQKISTHLLTMLIIRAIVQLEQKRGVQREQKEQKKFQVP